MKHSMSVKRKIPNNKIIKKIHPITTTTTSNNINTIRSITKFFTNFDFKNAFLFVVLSNFFCLC